MPKNLQNKLKGLSPSFTASEQRIASYLLHNMGAIPFETAASLGKRAGVSAMTVGRFLRKLGYTGLGELKEELRGENSWMRLYKNPLPSDDGDKDLAAKTLQNEINMLAEVHALARRPEWKPIVKLLATADRVSVASFQLGRFLGTAFAELLQQIRPHVSFADGTDGAYIDMLVDSTGKSCVVLIDERRYSQHFRILAEEVVHRGIPLVILTDTLCYWAPRLTPHVLMIPVNNDRAWHSFSSFSNLFSLLFSAVTQVRGERVLDRIEQITHLRQHFVGFDGPASSGQGNPGAKARSGSDRSKRRRNRKVRNKTDGT